MKHTTSDKVLPAYCRRTHFARMALPELEYAESLLRIRYLSAFKAGHPSVTALLDRPPRVAAVCSHGLRLASPVATSLKPIRGPEFNLL